MAGLGVVIGKPSLASSSTILDDRMLQYLSNVYKVLKEKHFPYIEGIQLLSLLLDNLPYESIMATFNCSR